jgi:site-specific DNA recombinase
MKENNTSSKIISNCVIYTRVSSKEQIEGHSLDVQEKTCRSFASSKNIKVLKVFREEGESAKTADRHKLNEMINFCSRKSNRVNYLLVYKVDRLARQQADHYFLKTILIKYGIKILSATEAITDDPQGKLMEGILSAFAEHDNNVRAMRSIDSMKSALRDGKWMFKAPIGYENKKLGKKNTIIVIDSKAALIIRMIFEEYIKGIYTFHQVAEIVKKYDIKNEYNVTQQVVAKVLRNKLYYGWIEVLKWGISNEGKHDQIISKEKYLKANAIISGNKGHKQIRIRNHPDFPLRGVRCMNCNYSISGGWTRGKTGKRYAYYCCGNVNCSVRKSISKEEFENGFTHFLNELMPITEHVSLLREVLKKVYYSEAEIEAKKRVQRDHRIHKFKKEKEKLLEMKLTKDDLLSDEDYRNHCEKIEKQISELEMLNVSIPTFDTEIERIIDFGEEFIFKLPKLWTFLNTADLKTLISILFPNNVFYEYPFFQTPYLPIIYRLNNNKSLNKNALGWLEGIEPSLAEPQSAVLPLNYSHHG